MSKDFSNADQSWPLKVLLERAGINVSAFRQMRRTGAVDAPTGTTSAARYSEKHLAQIRRVIDIAKRRKLSISAACEFAAAEASTPAKSLAVQSRVRAAADLSFRGNVRCWAPGVYLVYSKQLPAIEKSLVNEATKAFRTALAIRRDVKKLGATPFKALIHKLR